ncbi:uncharacterized protein LOC122012210 [Zingiber officinale]|uniref:EF-hand domain-containing protein n=1 Tax=Zingiber officinale TaxID=94328 RepID=A0A8J5LTF8_ZINOF|nr:uncharacterized protein LOC122008033 [Zingiber officinale]XP_042424608.1 uncharacterized protein LOC122012210 [Zingiber officinale]KAG6534149.1 hypothetical protein ZIOFF_008033 [Zingiber officinale]
MAFAHGYVLPQKEMSAGEFRAWLRQFDSDHDGRLTLDDLHRALRSLHAWFAWWKARRAMKQADVNRNGLIDMMKRSNSNGDDDDEEMNRLISYANQHLHMKIYQYDSSSSC